MPTAGSVKWWMTRLRKLGGGTKSASKMVMNSPVAVVIAAARAPALYPVRSTRCRSSMSTPRALPVLDPCGTQLVRAVGRIVEHLDLQPVRGVLQPARGVDDAVRHRALVEHRQLHGDARQLLEAGFGAEAVLAVLAEEEDQPVAVHPVGPDEYKQGEVRGGEGPAQVLEGELGEDRGGSDHEDGAGRGAVRVGAGGGERGGTGGAAADEGYGSRAVRDRAGPPGAGAASGARGGGSLSAVGRVGVVQRGRSPPRGGGVLAVRVTQAGGRPCPISAGGGEGRRPMGGSSRLRPRS